MPLEARTAQITCSRISLFPRFKPCIGPTSDVLKRNPYIESFPLGTSQIKEIPALA